MVRNDARHKKQFGNAGGVCLVIGGSARLGRMMRVFERHEAGAGLGARSGESANGRAMIWQGRRAAEGIDFVADPLVSGAVMAALGAGRVARKIDTVVCLAGVIRGDAAALAVNSDLAIAALETAQALGARRVVLASSAAVYGAQSGRLDEGLTMAPAAPYGAAKARMEEAARAWQAEHAPDLEVCAVRIGNVAGADALLGAAQNGAMTLDIFTDEGQSLGGVGPRRSYIGPLGFARAMARIIAAPVLPPVLNLALPGVVGMDDLLRAAGISFATRPAGAGGIGTVELDCDLAVGLGIVPPDAARAADIIADLRAYEALL